jgi:hypothetical protein
MLASPTGSILAAHPQVLDRLSKVGFLKMFHVAKERSFYVKLMIFD